MLMQLNLPLANSPFYQEQLGMSSLFVSEDEVKSFSCPFGGRGEDQTSLVKA